MKETPIQRLRRVLKCAVNKLVQDTEADSRTTSVKVFLKSGEHIDVEFHRRHAFIALLSIARDGQPMMQRSFEADVYRALGGDEFIDDETQINMLVIQLTERWNK